MKLTLSLIMAVLIGLCFTPAWAQDELNEGVFGVNDQYTWLSAWDFEQTTDNGLLPFPAGVAIPENGWYGAFNFIERFSVATFDFNPFGPQAGVWAAPIHIQDGARLVSARLYAWDSADGFQPFNTDPDITFTVFRERVFPASVRVNIGGPESTTGAPGRTFIPTPIGATIDNDNNLYWCKIDLNPWAGYVTSPAVGDHNHRFMGVRLLWRRQISDPPATATFGDVPVGSMFFAEIEALAASGITNGCGDGTNFCPEDYVKRQQMAAFLARAMGLYGGN